MLTRSRSRASQLLPLQPSLVRAALALGLSALVVAGHPGRARADDDERGWSDRGGPDQERPWAGDEEGDSDDRGRGWDKERKREEKERRREEKERWREEKELRREDRERRREWERQRVQEEQDAEDDLPPEGALLETSPQPVQAGPSYGEFQEALSPYGEWLDTPEYGRVWRPTQVSSDWRPYYQGHWAWTDAGWYWVADEPYGWAVYHYGRWAFSSGAGWIWLPGQQWAPAWVSWRWGDGYAGWCPLGPRGYVYARPVEYVIVQQQYFLQPVPRYAVPSIASASFFPLTRPMPAGRQGPHAGPVISAVAAATRQPVRPLAIVEASAPPRGAPAVSGGKVFVYRPRTVPVAVPTRGNGPSVRPAAVPGRQPGAPVERPAAGIQSVFPRPVAGGGRPLGPSAERPFAASPAPGPAQRQAPQMMPPVRARPEREPPARPAGEERGVPAAGPRPGASRGGEPNAGYRPYVSRTARPQASRPVAAARAPAAYRPAPVAPPPAAPRAVAGHVKQRN